MKKLTNERIYELSYVFADYIYSESITEGAKKECLEDKGEKKVYAYFELLIDYWIRYQPKNLISDENERTILLDNDDDLLDKIVKQTIVDFKNMCEKEVESNN